MKDTAQTRRQFVSAIVPARNEEARHRCCVSSLIEQQEIGEILVVDDHLRRQHGRDCLQPRKGPNPQVRLLHPRNCRPAGLARITLSHWAPRGKGVWLLFTDADVLHGTKSAMPALELARQHNASLVSFSPEQITETWFEKALIPVVYCRLGRKFSFDDVNDPRTQAAAANGQFLMISRDVYDACRGPCTIAGEVLEDVAFAKLVKEPDSGSGSALARYRSRADVSQLCRDVGRLAARISTD